MKGKLEGSPPRQRPQAKRLIARPENHTLRLREVIFLKIYRDHKGVLRFALHVEAVAAVPLIIMALGLISAAGAAKVFIP